MTDEILQNDEEKEEPVDMPNSEADEVGSEDKLVFKRSHLYSVLLPLAFVLGLSVGYLFWGRNTGASQPAPQVAAAQQDPAQAQATQAVKRYDVPVADIRQTNHLDSSQLFVGQQLTLPDSDS